MTPLFKVLLIVFMASLAGGLVWSANHYSNKYQAEKARADTAEQQANSASAVTDSVLKAVSIINAISEANQHAKNQIALDSQSAQKDIRVAVANDDCARRAVPAGAADRLREYADSLREGASGSATGNPDI